jgi:DNA repair photolyase
VESEQPVDSEERRSETGEAAWTSPPALAIRGRGAAENPANRFERLHYQPEPDDGATWSHAAGPQAPERAPSPRTVYLRDPSRTALAHNQSPDIGFDSSLNPYRGCEHGCAYCYARPTHEYLGFSAGLDFETRILVKEDAPELLRRELGSRRWRPEIVGLSGVTDPYQPIERRLELTRRCLRVFADFRNPVELVTKNGLVARDIDILAELAEHQAVAVNVSVTTLDAGLQRLLEPRASHPHERLKAIERLSQAGIPVGVLVAPIIPGLTEHEIPAILSAAAEAGASHAGHIVLRLPRGVKHLFTAWLERNFPSRRDKVLNRVRALRGGRLDDSRFGSRMKGEGVFASQIHDLFDLSRRRSGIPEEHPKLSTDAFRRPADAQLKLFRP